MNDADNADDAAKGKARDAPPPRPTAHSHNEGILSEAKAKGSDSSKEREEKTLLESTRTIEWLQFVVNFGLAIIGIVALCIYGSQLKEMKRATDAASEAASAASHQSVVSTTQLELSERPWVYPSQVQAISPLTQDLTGAHMNLRIVLRNTGPTPAQAVTVDAELFVEHYLRVDPLTEGGGNACNHLVRIPHGVGAVLFPSVDQSEELTLGVTRDAIRREIERARGQLPLPAEVIICISYQPAFRDLTYHTFMGYAFDRAFPPNAVVPLKDLGLHVQPLGTSSAN